MAINQKEIELAAEEIDRLIRVAIPPKLAGAAKVPIIEKLYSSARKRLGNKPLTLLAAQQLMKRIKPKDTVIFLTGWTIRNWMEAETDGPPGCASLARALSLGLKAVPIIVTEEKIAETVSGAFRGAGLHQYPINETSNYQHRFGTIGLPAGISAQKSKNIIKKLLDEVNPTALIAIEKAGPNKKGVYHSARGEDISAINSKAGILVDEARKRNILTIGMGDLGNEIGMGLVKETVEKFLPIGKKCKCPCQGGIACETATDIAIPCSISNWGAYGIEACLALLLDQLEIMHDGKTEDFIYNEFLRSNAISGPLGLSSDSPYLVDQVPKNINRYIVEIIYFIVSSRLVRSKSQDSFIKDIVAKT
ncbi:glutamate cyclase domain-containing protein [Thermodesulfobacteriota bacterium]